MLPEHFAVGAGRARYTGHRTILAHNTTTSTARLRDPPAMARPIPALLDMFDRLLAAWFGNITRVLIPGGTFYIWGGYANLGNYPPFLKKNELYFSQGIVWDKQHPVLTRKDFMGAFEIAFYEIGRAHV